jgi:hypothetical protein
MRHTEIAVLAYCGQVVGCNILDSTQLLESKQQGALIVRCSPLEGQPLACTNQWPILSMGGYRGVMMLLLILMLCLSTALTATAQDAGQGRWEVQLIKQTKDYREYKCVKDLIYKESSNNPNARTGSHYGLPQGRTRYLATASPTAQITWMMKYIRARYDDGCAALRHHNTKGWY